MIKVTEKAQHKLKGMLDGGKNQFIRIHAGRG